MFKTIKTNIMDNIMTITLNRPDRLNAYTEFLGDEIIQALDHADENDEVRVLIMTGEGKAFCAGADLDKDASIFRSETSMEDYRDGGGLVSLRIFELNKPIIAAINGPAVGVGITMTLPMDIRIASENAKMGFVFARRGITQEACSGWFLPRIVGISQAIEWVSTGRVFSAQEAKEHGLVSRVVPADELLSTSRQLAAEIVENTSAVSVALNRQLMWRMLGADHPMESHKVESKYIYWTGRNADVQEGVEAFLEKRKPNFSLRVSSDMPDFYPWWEEREFK
ncbi:crotonase/enoyl-CoA hydratase family protein [Oceanobacillus caeni]|uniref:crotonase/enoyl-CoA hydratase family protein n=1 Tax=Oceanobacillus caeni TaxID=405946 RepID=UPI001C233AC3|nr:crotonase/enoyl-CoA hydratase family protein [Oceanobacillus caeni]MBU8789257.1 crotonase/enoyl-CoA hydratase family protein [Oceanobacillus caeni]